jgi:protein ImuB
MAQMAIQAKRPMFVWLPNFAMTHARLKQPPLARPQAPLALFEKHGNIRRIAALDGPAIQAGLYLHQPLADALAVYPKLIVADAEPEACEQALTALAAWAQRYSPLTAPGHGSGLWLDIAGCAHLWGGEAGLATDLLGRLEARGIPARAAIAPTFGAAYALAHHAERYVIAPDVTPESTSVLIRGLDGNQGSSSGKIPDRARRAPFRDDLPALLAPLPVERLRIGGETASLLRKLGLFTIGSLQKLPRASLSRRFPDLLPQLDKALGLAQEAIEFLRAPTPWIERLRFAEPISAPGDLERVTAKLLEMLCARLEAQRQGGLTFEISFFRSDGGVQALAVSAALPTRDAARMMRLFREKLEFIDPGFGVDLAMLAVPHAEPLDERQSSILKSGQGSQCVEELAALIDALENRLGKGRVYRLAPQESHIPERAVKRQGPLPSSCPSPSKLASASLPLGVTASASGCGGRRNAVAKAAASSLSHGERVGVRGEGAVWQHMGERPIRLFARPQPIDVTAALPDAPPVLFRWRKVLHRIVRAEGPERIAPEWWRGSDAGESDETRDYYRVESTAGLRFWVFREGTYGGERLPRWYLHGLFP